jgi:hypothetical protein
VHLETRLPSSDLILNCINTDPHLTLATNKADSVAFVPQANHTKWPPLVGEVSAKFYGYRGCFVVSAMGPHGCRYQVTHTSSNEELDMKQEYLNICVSYLPVSENDIAV